MNPTRQTFQKPATRVAVLTLLVGMAALSAPAQAAVYSAVDDFSTTSNTASGTWSYRVSSSLAHDGNYNLLPNFGPFAGFTGPAGDTAGWAVQGVPAIGLNRSGADQFFVGFGPGAQFVWPAGSLFMHPGPAALAVVSWLSPFDALLSINFRFDDMDANLNFGDGIDWAVERNSGGATLASGSFLNGGNSGDRALANISVLAGDRIHFTVGPNRDFQGDSSRLVAIINATPLASAVPEPGTWALSVLGVGLGLGFGRGLRRHRAGPTDTQRA